MAKRVNTRFLAILTAVVLVGGVAAMAAVYVLPKVLKKNPNELAAAAERLEKDGKWEEASQKLGAAARADQKNPERFVALGDLFGRHIAEDQQNFMKMRGAWEAAISIDPTHKPALQRLLDTAVGVIDLSPRPESFSAVRDAAKRLLVADPANRAAKVRLHAATVQSRLQHNIPVPPADMQAAVKALHELAAEDPSDADAAYWAIEGDLWFAMETVRNNVADRSEAQEMLAKVAPAIAAMQKGQEQNGPMQWRAGLLYMDLFRSETVLSQAAMGLPTSRAAAPATRPVAVAGREAAGRHTPAVEAAFQAARAHIKPEYPRYLEVMAMAAEWLKLTGRADEGRKIIQGLAEQRPDDAAARYFYAREFRNDPARRDTIIQLLERPLPTGGLSGIDAVKAREHRTNAEIELAKLRLAGVDGERDPAKRQQIMDRVQEDVRRIEAQGSGESVHLYELRGRLELAGNNVDAGIKHLQTAVDRAGEFAGPELMLSLSQAYAVKGQTGQAERLLRRVVERHPSHLASRVLWVRALHFDNKPDQAREQLDVLRRLHPKAQEIAGLQALVLGGKVREQFVGNLPEGTPAERVRKAAELQMDNKPEEAIEQLREAVKADPKFLPAVELLIGALVDADRLDELRAVIDEALAANPQVEALKRLQAAATKGTRADIDAWQLEEMKRDADPLAREVRLMQWNVSRGVAANQRGDREAGEKYLAAAEANLAAAERAKPGDPGLARRRFDFLLFQRKLDDAAALVQQLANRPDAPDDLDGMRFRLAMARRDYAAAEAAARELTRLRPQYATGHQFLGSAMLAQGRHADAVTHFNAALERQGRNAEALRGLIEAQRALNETAEVKVALDRALAAFPNDPGFREAALDFDLTHGDAEKVAAERERIYKDNPNNAVNAQGLVTAYAYVAARQKDPAKKQAYLDKTRRLVEEGMNKWPADVRFVRAAAQFRLTQGDFLGGEKLLKDYAARPEVTEKAAVTAVLAEYYRMANKPAMTEQALRQAMGMADKEYAQSIRRELVTLLLQTGRPDEALKELDGQTDETAALQRVRILVTTNRAAEAEQAVAQALKDHPNSTQLSNSRIEIFVNTGRFGDAEQVVQQRLARDGGDEEARYFGAAIKMRKQPPDYAAAIRDLQDLAARNPKNLTAQAALADARYASGDTGGAIDDLDRALQMDAGNRLLRSKMIDWSLASSRWDLVVRLASDAINNPRIGQNEPAWFRPLATALAAKGDFAKAEQAITRAIGMVPAEQAGEFQRDHLVILNQAKNYARVIQVTDGYVAKGRKDWWIYQFRGLARAGLKDKNALAEFDTALANLDPDRDFGVAATMIRSIAQAAGLPEALKRTAKHEQAGKPAWQLLAAEMCLGARDYAGALQHLKPLEAGLDQSPRDVQANFHRITAQAYHQAKTPDYAKAAAAYKAYLKFVPNDAFTLNNLAYLLGSEIQPPQLAEAVTYSKQAYELARNAPAGEGKGRIYDTHGWLLVLQGPATIDEGIRVLKEAADESPILEVHYHLGEAQLRKKRGEEAEDQLTRALAYIERAKKEKRPYDETLEPRIQDALKLAKALNAAAGAR